MRGAVSLGVFQRLKSGRPVSDPRSGPEREFEDAVADRGIVLCIFEEQRRCKAAAAKDLLRQADLAELAHERAAVTLGHDHQDRFRVLRFDPGQCGTIVGGAVVEIIFAHQLGAQLCHERLVGVDGASSKVGVFGDHREGFGAIGHVFGKRRGHDQVVGVDAEPVFVPAGTIWAYMAGAVDVLDTAGVLPSATIGISAIAAELPPPSRMTST